MLEACDISFGYASATIFAGVNCEARAGEIVGIVGCSGVGKTSLLNVLAGYAEPTSGVVSFRGEASVRDAARKQRIGFVFQTPTLLPFRTVAENVHLPLEMRVAKQLKTHERNEARVARALDWARIGHAAASYPHELSGGMQTRAALARVMVYEPDLVLLDEPFTGLDEVLREELQRDLRRMTVDNGIATVLVSHDLREAVVLCDRIYVMARRDSGVATLIAEHIVDRASSEADADNRPLISRLRVELKGTP